MKPGRLIELLQPFLPPTTRPPLRSRPGLAQEESAIPSQSHIENLLGHLDLLLRWNARVNLTAIRQPEEIVTRHFGESFFAARYLFPDPQTANAHVIDVGSGAGFPGLPIKIWAPGIGLTLIESNHKKATFLREVVRKLALPDVEVFSSRAETYPNRAEVVALRAVERFEQAVPIALRLLQPRGRLAMLIGSSQVQRARELAPDMLWNDAVAIPLSSGRVLLIGMSAQSQNQSR